MIVPSPPTSPGLNREALQTLDSMSSCKNGFLVLPSSDACLFEEFYCNHNPPKDEMPLLPFIILMWIFFVFCVIIKITSLVKVFVVVDITLSLLSEQSREVFHFSSCGFRF